MRQTRQAFPAGLYGMLLLALCSLTLPAFFAPVERLLVGAVCLVPRTVAVLTGAPAAAAHADVAERARGLQQHLHERIEAHDLLGAATVMPPAWQPVVCGVVAIGERGGGGEPSELWLDRSYAELADCSDVVTKGPAMVGWLQRAGVGVAVDEGEDARARVLLLNHRSARPLAATADLPEGGSLRMVVGPAARSDPAPLLTEQWDDPYRAARLDRSGQLVRTLSLTHGVDEPPAGLWLGRTRIWGYEAGPATDVLTIAVFLAPPIEPRALSHVVVWRRSGIEPGVPAPRAAAPERRHAATVWDLPGASLGRHLLVAGIDVPDGAAVVQDGLCIGTARGIAFGMALVTSFAASQKQWSLLLLPDDPADRPRELTGQVVEATPGGAWLRWRGDTLAGEGQRLPAGYLFTGSNGRHCPAGLLLGRAQPHPFERDLCEVLAPARTGTGIADVLVAEDGR